MVDHGMKRLWLFGKRNAFLLWLLVAFLLVDGLVAAWNPMESTRRFYKNDFTKTLYHHDWERSGPVFFGNSAVTGAYIEEQAAYPLVEMGLAYGRITDLKGILQHELYRVERDLVIGIDVHTMIDEMDTDPTYQWFKPWYVPYLYQYRDYFRDSGEEFVRQLWKGIVNGDREQLFAYQPRWINKELYFGRKDDAFLEQRWAYYDQRWGHLQLDDFADNLAALEWVIDYTERHDLSLKVIWMPWNPAYPHPPYVASLKDEVNRMLTEHEIPVLDVMDRYAPEYFHDLVHLNREEGAPLFTKEVDEWLLSFAKSSKS